MKLRSRSPKMSTIFKYLFKNKICKFAFSSVMNENTNLQKKMLQIGEIRPKTGLDGRMADP